MQIDAVLIGCGANVTCMLIGCLWPLFIDLPIYSRTP